MRLGQAQTTQEVPQGDATLAVNAKPNRFMGVSTCQQTFINCGLGQPTVSTKGDDLNRTNVHRKFMPLNVAKSLTRFGHIKETQRKMSHLHAAGQAEEWRKCSEAEIMLKKAEKLKAGFRAGQSTRFG